MKFAIRDDDTSFFTSPDDILKAYDFLKGGCLSLSVVPNTVAIHKDCVFPYASHNTNLKYNCISDNRVLVEWLNEQQKKQKIDILLHGYSHEYKKIHEKWRSEMIWKDYKSIHSELLEAKELFKKLFGTQPTVFVAPNNHISSKGIRAIEELGMNYSGTIGFLNRPFSFKMLSIFIKRWFFRIANGYSTTEMFDYGKHKEIQAFPVDNWERLLNEFNLCKKYDTPFVIYTHYWKVNNDKNVKDLLIRIYEHAINNCAELVSLSSMFNEKD